MTFEEWAQKNHISRMQIELNTPMADWARRAWDSSRHAAMEEAAQRCEELRQNRPTTEAGLLIASECAAAIRALASDGLSEDTK